MSTPCYLNNMGMICSAGADAAAFADALLLEPSLPQCDYLKDHLLPLGRMPDPLPALPAHDAKWDTRNNRAAFHALTPLRADLDGLIERFGAHRIGVVIGTSTSGIAESEEGHAVLAKEGSFPASFHYSTQEMGATAQFIAQELGVKGPVFGISTACSSGAKAIASARRLIRANLCDVVIAGGVDTLCQLTVQGFSSLEAVSDAPCRPFDQDRRGINIGEAAALFIVSKEPHGVAILGVGESSDAHHISAPDPQGHGAQTCMEQALTDANCRADEVGYVNLHGTATPLNDQMEARAMAAVFPPSTPCSSTKPYTGHTLGAAGALEAALCYLLLTDQLREVPQQAKLDTPDPELPTLNWVQTHLPTQSVDTALSNSYAFGGNNIALLLGRVQ
jgi:3-oxoacyl-[acyl-carrier-protein] synthase-1